MANMIKGKYSKKKKSKGVQQARNNNQADHNNASEIAELELLERKYIREYFYNYLDVIFINACLAFLGLNLFLALILPDMRYCSAVAIATWLFILGICRHVSKYKGTDQELYGKKTFEFAMEIVWLVFELVQARKDVASEENRNAHISMEILAGYCLALIVVRMAIPKYKKGALWCAIIPLLSFRYPRFGIMSPGYEAFAFLVAVAVGLGLGGIIDEMRWRYFLMLHEKDLQFKKQAKEFSRTCRRAEALESLACGQESPFFEIIR